MKILFDMIPSSLSLRKCSSMLKVKSLIEEARAQNRGWFFYWMLPWPMGPEDAAWLQSVISGPDVRVIPYPYWQDRMREYQQFSLDLDAILAFNGPSWDYDVLVTSRTSQLANARACMSAPRQVRRGRFVRKVILIEEMEVLDFRVQVAKSDLQAQESLTLAGYLAADLITIQTSRERAGILNAARGYLSPSRVREIDDKLEQVMPFVFTELELKDPRFRYDGTRPFVLNFSGRLEKFSANLDTLYKAMSAAWIGAGAGMRITINTLSPMTAYTPPPMVEYKVTDREAFWRDAREEMDLQLVLHKDAEFSLTLIEPMMMGVPLIVARHPWADEVYGPDYPYKAKNDTEAVAWIKLAREDYEAFYARFAEWQQTSFKKALATGRYSRLMTPTIVSWIALHEAHLTSDTFRERFQEHADNPNMRNMVDEARSAGDFTLFDLLRRSPSLERFRDKIGADDRNMRRLSFSTGWNELRLILKGFAGFEDASTVTGHLRLPDAAPKAASLAP